MSKRLVERCRQVASFGAVLLGAGASFVACRGGEGDGGGDSTVGSAAGAGSTGGGPNSGTGGWLLATGGLGHAGSGAGSAEGGACAETRAEATLRRVHLAFLFDVSGSMGALDHPWHDPALKWEPVVAGTTAFFADPASAGLDASLTFFPSASDRCDAGQYDEPDVPFTELPSPALAAAIDEIGAASADDWRGGTPTLAVVTGTLARLMPLAATELDSTYAIVMVSDGYPQSCDDNSIESVAAAVSEVAATIPTYVIGVRNPPLEGAPETVANLDAIAVAGGTEHAYFIDTGDPTRTTSDLLAAVNAIRGQTLSCDLAIPPPPAGRELDAQRVRVQYTSGSTTQDLPYDADCVSVDGWRYDDPEAPASIHLCPTACATVQADPAAALSVAFACEVVIPVLY